MPPHVKELPFNACAEMPDPGFTHAYFNLSSGSSVRGPWNQGSVPWENA